MYSNDWKRIWNTSLTAELKIIQKQIQTKYRRNFTLYFTHGSEFDVP